MARREEIFRAKVLAMLKAEGKIGDETIGKLLTWKHSGFSVHNGVRVRRSDEVDPLSCPHCGGEMKIISFISEFPVIRQILEHLGLWGRGGLSRDPPKQEPLPEVVCLPRDMLCIYRGEPFDDGWPGYEEPSFVM